MQKSPKRNHYNENKGFHVDTPFNPNGFSQIMIIITITVINIIITLMIMIIRGWGGVGRWVAVFC